MQMERDVFSSHHLQTLQTRRIRSYPSLPSILLLEKGHVGSRLIIPSRQCCLLFGL
jgi:hypothetical protein